VLYSTQRELTADEHQNYNGNFAIVPLRYSEKLNIDQWFGRGLKAYPPAPGDFMELPSGGVFEGESVR